MNTETYLKTAKEAALSAKKIFLKSFGHPSKVETKNSNPRDFVTEIDRKIERIVRKALKKNFPTHKIIGEEYEKAEISKNDLVWIIDPIDGTANYIQGLPFCAISIGLWDKQGPLVSALYGPALDYFFWAQRGRGAFLNGRRLNCSKHEKVISAFGGYGWGRNIKNAAEDFPKLVGVLNKIRTLGSTSLEQAMVASGAYDFHLQAGCSVWDFAASALLVTESGGKITDWKGNKITMEAKNLLASNSKIHKELLSKVKTLL